MNRRPRRAGPLWAWVLGFLILIVIIWILVARVGDTSADVSVAPSRTPAPEGIVADGPLPGDLGDPYVAAREPAA